MQDQRKYLFTDYLFLFLRLSSIKVAFGDGVYQRHSHIIFFANTSVVIRIYGSLFFLFWAYVCIDLLSFLSFLGALHSTEITHTQSSSHTHTQTITCTSILTCRDAAILTLWSPVWIWPLYAGPIHFFFVVSMYIYCRVVAAAPVESCGPVVLWSSFPFATILTKRSAVTFMFCTCLRETTAEQKRKRIAGLMM